MIKIVNKAIDLQKVIDDARGDEFGALSVFIGTVRNKNEGKRVKGIIYECYKEMAEKHLKDIEKEIKEKWSPVRVSIVHRVGKLKVGEVSVVIAIGTPHRADSFSACRYAIERIKEYLPVWKQELYESGMGWVKGKPIRVK